jgi:hypothetical protein
MRFFCRKTSFAMGQKMQFFALLTDFLTGIEPNFLHAHFHFSERELRNLGQFHSGLAT